MGRWKLKDGRSQDGPSPTTPTVDLKREGRAWALTPPKSSAAVPSSDADRSRIWWTDAGVHQNMTFPVQPDPVSGAHCWHQAVRVERARPGDRYGDIAVDTAESRRAFRQWLELARPAQQHSPDGSRRPFWLLRPVRPQREAFRLPPSGRNVPS